MAADDFVTQGAKASAAKILTQLNEDTQSLRVKG